MTITQRRITRFLDKLQDSSIENYFGIINNKNNTLHFTFQNELENELENEIILTIHFKADYKCYDILELPIEISRLIASYNDYFINIKIKILFINNYPFIRPIWVLLDVQDNVCSSLNLMEYFTYIVNNHNSQYKRCWTPAIDVEKDVLEFIHKINHFDYILNNN